MTLKIYITEMVQECGGIRPTARRLHVNPGLIHYVLNGGDSPMLRKKLGILKHPRRNRLIIEIDPAVFDTQRGNTPRADFMEALLDHWQGIAELRY